MILINALAGRTRLRAAGFLFTTSSFYLSPLRLELAARPEERAPRSGWLVGGLTSGCGQGSGCARLRAAGRLRSAGWAARLRPMQMGCPSPVCARLARLWPLRARSSQLAAQSSRLAARPTCSVGRVWF